MSPRLRNRPKKLLTSIFGGGCLMILFCGFGGFLLLAKMFRDDSARLPTDRDRAHELGLPLSADEFRQTGVKTTTGGNAAPLYIRANAELLKLPRSQDRHLWFRRNASGQARKETDCVLASFRPTMELLKDAAKIPYCQFDESSPLGNYFLMGLGAPQNGHTEIQFDRMCTYIGASIYRKIGSGDLDEALREAAILIEMANNAPEYSTLMGAQWRVTAIREVTGASWRILLRHPGDLTILDRVGKLLDRVKMPDLYRSLQVNFILGLSEIETIKSLQELGLDRNTPPAFNQAVDNLYETPGVRQAFEAQYLKTYMGTFAALPKDREAWPDIYYALKKFDKGVQEDRSLENSLNHALLTNSPLTALLYGATQSGLHVLVQAVAALRIHARTGVYPTTMPVPGSNSVDPLWGKPLTYSLLKDGFSVASKGRDFGKDGPFYTKNGIVFRFPPVRELARRRLTY